MQIKIAIDDQDAPGKVVVRVNRKISRGRTANAVRTAGYVDKSNLVGSRYDLLEGTLDE